MIGRNTRGIRRASSMRVRLAVAAAVLVGGGAAGVAVVANHSGTVDASSAGYYSHSQLSESHAMSAAMNSWNRSPQNSLSLISRMTPMHTFSMTKFHTHTLAIQRGTVEAAIRNEFVIKSSNHQLELWFVNGGTKFLNVGGSTMGMNAMTGRGSMMSMPNHMSWNKGARVLAKGDFVFIFGEKVHGKLLAQLVLFVAPMKVTATPTPSMTTSPTMTATATPTATSTATVAPTATTSTSFSGNNS